MSFWKLLIPELEEIMATVADLKAAFDGLKTDLTAALARVEADVKFLKDKLAAGNVIEQADLDALVGGIGAARATVQALDPVPDNPPTT